MPGGVMTAVATALAANATVNNIFAGNAFEFIMFPSIVRFYIVGSAVGVMADIIVGNESYATDQEVSGAGRFPIRNEDLLLELGALPGERILVNLRNRTAGALTADSLVEILPV